MNMRSSSPSPTQVSPMLEVALTALDKLTPDITTEGQPKNLSGMLVVALLGAHKVDPNPFRVSTLDGKEAAAMAFTVLSTLGPSSIQQSLAEHWGARDVTTAVLEQLGVAARQLVSMYDHLGEYDLGAAMREYAEACETITAALQ